EYCHCGQNDVVSLSPYHGPVTQEPPVNSAAGIKQHTEPSAHCCQWLHDSKSMRLEQLTSRKCRTSAFARSRESRTSRPDVEIAVVTKNSLGPTFWTEFSAQLLRAEVRVVTSMAHEISNPFTLRSSPMERVGPL